MDETQRDVEKTWPKIDRQIDAVVMQRSCKVNCHVSGHKQNR